MKKDIYIETIKNYGNNERIEKRIQYYKKRLSELKKFWDYEFDIEIKFDLMDLLNELVHEFHISAVIPLQEELRKKNPEILEVYFEMKRIIDSPQQIAKETIF